VKKVKLVEVTRLTGKPFGLLEFDENDEVVLDKERKPVLKRTKNLLDVLEYFILRGLPRDKYTKLDALRVSNTYRSIQEARKNSNGILELDEPEHDWLKSKLNDDAIGVRMFTFDAPALVEAVENIVKPHEPKEK